MSYTMDIQTTWTSPRLARGNKVRRHHKLARAPFTPTHKHLPKCFNGALVGYQFGEDSHYRPVYHMGLMEALLVADYDHTDAMAEQVVNHLVAHRTPTSPVFIE